MPFIKTTETHNYPDYVMSKSQLKLNSIQSLFFCCMAILIAFIDKAPLQLDHRIGTHYIEDGFYVMYNGILNNTMQAPYPYRFLMPYCIDVLSKIFHQSPINIAFCLNIVCLIVVLHLFAKYARTFLPAFLAFLTTLLLAFFITIVQTQIMGIIIIETQDIVNAVFLIVLLLLAYHEKWWLFGLVLAFSVLNRETNLILLAPYSWLLFKKNKFKPLLFINVISIAVYIGIRIMIPVDQGDYPNFANLKTNFPGLDMAFFWKALEHNLHLFCMIFPVLLLAFWNFKSQNNQVKALLFITLPYLIIHYIMGTIIELRLFLPLIIVLLPITVNNLKTLFESEQNHTIQS